jgi:hypothetical protein
MDFSSILHFLTDKSRKISTKAIVIVLSLLLLAIIDNTFSFSYFYNTSNKVNQLQKISEILKDKTLDKTENEKILLLRKDILTHQTYKDKIYNYLTNLDFDTTEKIDEAESNQIGQRNEYIHLLTSAWWLLLPIGLLILLYPYIIISERKQILNTTIGLIFLTGLSYLVSLLLSKIFSFIPLIDNNPIYNYILNFILSGLILLIITLMGNKVKKMKKTIANNV